MLRSAKPASCKCVQRRACDVLCRARPRRACRELLSQLLNAARAGALSALQPIILSFSGSSHMVVVAGGGRRRPPCKLLALLTIQGELVDAGAGAGSRPPGQACGPGLALAPREGFGPARSLMCSRSSRVIRSATGGWRCSTRCRRPCRRRRGPKTALLTATLPAQAHCW